MAKLSVRLVKPAFGDGVIPLLCDDDGNALPGQRSVIINSRIDDVVTVTVEFVVGNDVTIDATTAG